MGDPRKVDFHAEEALRNRTLNLLSSYAAKQVRFTFLNIPFNGLTGFPQVADALKALEIGFRIGNVEEHAAAHYDMVDDLIVVKNYDYGQKPEEEQVLIHECFHAWRDIQGWSTVDGDGKRALTLAATDEAMAYLTGALFLIHRTGTTAFSYSKPLFKVAHGIAAKMVEKKGSVFQPKPSPVVTTADVRALWIAVFSSPAYENLLDDPTKMYRNNGV